MAVLLADAAKMAPTKLQRGVIETFILESSVLDRLPMMQITGNAYAYNAEGTLPGVEFRAVNSAYSESTGTVNTHTEKLVIMGGDADVDRFIQMTMSDLNDQRAVQTRMKVKSAVYKFQDAFINGDVAVDANGFDGLKKRLINNQHIVADTDGVPVLGDLSDLHAVWDIIDEGMSRVKNADAIYGPKALISKLKSSARRLTAYTETTDAFGKKISMYDGVPLLDIGKRADGTDIIPMTETTGSATDTGSLYIVDFGDDEADGGVTGITNGGIMVDDLGQLQEKPAYRTRIEWYLGVGLFSGRAASRISGLRAV